MPEAEQTYGLVVAGGKSQRMGRDKSFLVYYDKPQVYYVYDMLMPLCEAVYISCNKNQAGRIDPGYQFLTDKADFADSGPLSALLTAFTSFPGKNFLIAGCDYPYLNSRILKNFLSVIKTTDKPVVFYNENHQLYEPLIGWYPSGSADFLYERFLQGEFSIQSWLKNIRALPFIPDDEKVMLSVDTAVQYEQVLKEIRKSS